jgi:nucleotide-binding universal stress UspA family protein
MADDNAPILVGVDGSRSSIDALRYAADLAKVLDAPLRVVTAWEYPALVAYYPTGDWSPEIEAASVLATSILEAFGKTPPSGLTKELLEGPVARRLIEESGRSRMLVLGSRGAGGFTRLLLGSVSATCAEHAHCPVLIVRPPSSKVRGPSHSAREYREEPEAVHS